MEIFQLPVVEIRCKAQLFAHQPRLLEIEFVVVKAAAGSGAQTNLLATALPKVRAAPAHDVEIFLRHNHVCKCTIIRTEPAANLEAARVAFLH